MEMNILIYVLVSIMTIVAEVYPMAFPAMTWKESEGYVKILQLTVFCLFLYCSWFYGRT